MFVTKLNLCVGGSIYEGCILMCCAMWEKLMGNYNTFGRLVVQWMHCQIKFVLLISSGCGYSDHYFPCFKPM